MRTLIATIFLCCCTTLLQAQTIDQKMVKLAAKGYLPKEYIPQIKQIIHLKEDSVSEAGVLLYLYIGDRNFNSNGILKDHLIKVKETRKMQPQRVLQDMVQAGMIEQDSVARWVRQQITNDSAIFLIKNLDVFKYLNSAGEFEDAVKPHRILPMLVGLDSLQLISQAAQQQIKAKMAKKQLHSLWDVFAPCKAFTVCSTAAPEDMAKAMRQRILDIATTIPKITLTDVSVQIKEINTVQDSIYITVTCDGKSFWQGISIYSGNRAWQQIEDTHFQQILNKVLTAHNLNERIYEVSIDSDILGVNRYKGFWVLTATQHFGVQDMQKNKSAVNQLFKLYPN